MNTSERRCTASQGEGAGQKCKGGIQGPFRLGIRRSKKRGQAIKRARPECDKKVKVKCSGKWEDGQTIGTQFIPQRSVSCDIRPRAINAANSAPTTAIVVSIFPCMYRVVVSHQVRRLSRLVFVGLGSRTAWTWSAAGRQDAETRKQINEQINNRRVAGCKWSGCMRKER